MRQKKSNATDTSIAGLRHAREERAEVTAWQGGLLNAFITCAGPLHNQLAKLSLPTITNFQPSIIFDKFDLNILNVQLRPEILYISFKSAVTRNKDREQKT